MIWTNQISHTCYPELNLLFNPFCNFISGVGYKLPNLPDRTGRICIPSDTHYRGRWRFESHNGSSSACAGSKIAYLQILTSSIAYCKKSVFNSFDRNYKVKLSITRPGILHIIFGSYPFLTLRFLRNRLLC